ncbi:hypothetical protein AAWM_00414 [Aspergillus awamori]|uniref:Uncharacterized protein n=1 Tax=Aspergillus awamori TaxID=105351 RepID=A0A401KE90_ASPAW|nr:hypothetical protein AAWM_00414 [Aspergillus awamori]GKZ52397.1 hypothetical protein AnigIFM49718_000275 [Aspergillus niger]GKZ65684.1 hypothetical protein AnigIFM50267_009456 [Aspergillus niger]
MKASILTALTLAACSFASPVGQLHARDGECTCQPNGGSSSGSGSGPYPGSGSGSTPGSGSYPGSGSGSAPGSGSYPGSGSGSAPGSGSYPGSGSGSGSYPGSGSGSGAAPSSGSTAPGSGSYPGSGAAPSSGAGSAPGTGSGSAPGTGSGSYPGSGAGSYPGSGSGSGPQPSQVSTYPASQVPTLPGYQPQPTITLTTTVPVTASPGSPECTTTAPAAPAGQPSGQSSGQPAGPGAPTGPAGQSPSPAAPAGPTGPAGQPSGPSTPASQPSGPAGQPSGPAGPSGPANSGYPGNPSPSSPWGAPTSSVPAGSPSQTPSCENGHCHGTGHLLQDLGVQADHLLTVVGNGTEQLLVQLSKPVADVLSSLGLTGLAKPVGHIIKDAGSIGELVTDLGAPVEQLLVVTGKDTGYLLIQLDQDVKGLLDGIGLDALGEPVGDLLGAIGSSLKRRQNWDYNPDAKNPNGLLEKLGPVIDCILVITGEDAKDLIVKLSKPVAELFEKLGLTGLGKSVGKVIKTVGDAGDLVADLGPVSESLLTVVGDGGSKLVVQLAPDVADLVKGLGLPKLGDAVGEVLGAVGENL